MQIRVLGSSGGIASGYRTTSFLIDDDILLDAGTGVEDLGIEEMVNLRHVFITHSHFDHIAALPLLADTVFDKIPGPIQVHALPETIQALQQHVFNDVLWPDFTRIPNRQRPVFQLQPMMPGQVVTLGERRVEMIPVKHLVPGVGYRVESEGRAFAFSGDTTTNDTFWEVLNRHDRLDLLFVESAFPNSNCELGRRSGHYCPQSLADDLRKLRHYPRICISHPKPGEEGNILAECQAAIPERRLEGLRAGEYFAL